MAGTALTIEVFSLPRTKRSGRPGSYLHGRHVNDPEGKKLVHSIVGRAKAATTQALVHNVLTLTLTLHVVVKTKA